MISNVLVSILTYNGGEKTIRTISDVISQKIDRIKMDLVVVDNCSSNNIVERIKSTFPHIDVIRNERNLGFSDGNNLAIALAFKKDVDFLFILNDDIRIEKNYIQEMTREGMNHPNAAVLGSTIRLTNGRIQAVGGQLKPWYTGIHWINVKTINSQNTANVVDAIQGSAFVLTRTALQKGFRFDSCLFFGEEEFDLSCWAKSVSLKSYVLEHVEVIHDTNQAQLVANRWYVDPVHYYYIVRNEIYIKRKYKESLVQYSFSVSYTLVRFVVKGLIFILRGNIIMIKYILQGIWDGFTNHMGRLIVEPKR